MIAIFDAYPDGMAGELLAAGYPLRSIGRMIGWHDAWLIAHNARPGGPLASALDPSNAWTRAEWMLRSIEYSARWLVWAQTKDGQKNRRRPQPIPSPAAARPSPTEQAGRKTVLLDRADLTRMLRRPRRQVSARGIGKTTDEKNEKIPTD